MADAVSDMGAVTEIEGVELAVSVGDADPAPDAVADAVADGGVVQKAAPRLEKEPGGHGVQRVAPTSEKKFTSQGQQFHQQSWPLLSRI